jgi:hypothetical protein
MNSMTRLGLAALTVGVATLALAGTARADVARSSPMAQLAAILLASERWLLVTWCHVP